MRGALVSPLLSDGHPPLLQGNATTVKHNVPGATGLEPATSCGTGKRCNQLSLFQPHSVDRSLVTLPCHPPVFWALSRIIHATTSFDAAVAVPGEIYSRAMNSLPHRNDVVLTHSRKPDRRSGFSWQERLGIPNSGAPQTISPTLTGEEDRGLREEHELCWLGREGRQQRHSTPLRQSRENLDQAFTRSLLPTRIGEHLQSHG